MERVGVHQWLGHLFAIYERDVAWEELPGVYLLCRWTPWTSGKWSVLYVGETSNFRMRLTRENEMWTTAFNSGMTHIHARQIGNRSLRQQIEKDLIEAFLPPLNMRRKI